MKRPFGIDMYVISNLEILGSDLKTKHGVEFFLYFPEEYQAFQAATELSNFQFKTSVNYSDFSKKWLCFAVKSMIIDTDRIVQIDNLMENIAERNHGNYDGWGSGIQIKED